MSCQLIKNMFKGDNPGDTYYWSWNHFKHSVCVGFFVGMSLSFEAGQGNKNVPDILGVSVTASAMYVACPLIVPFAVVCVVSNQIGTMFK